VDMSTGDLEALRRAKRLLGNTSLAARLANAAGKPIEQFTRMFPRAATEAILTATNKALQTALDVAIRSLGTRQVRRADALHKAAVGATGAIGGAFGLAAIALELPASTTLMLRSIADIARSEGESLASPEARLACLQVFALGGPAPQDDAAEAGYFAVRAAMAKALEEAAEYVTRHGVTSRAAPALVRFVTQIAARFGVPVSEKFVAQSVPVIGAAGGATINVLFLDHFQDLARGHFIVRRLERKYGPDLVRDVYATL
jgi:EcsC protein family